MTILELLIAISVVGLLLAIILPAVSYSREASRRGQCLSNLRQMGIAIHGFESSHKMYPLGGDEKGYSLHVSLLPEIDQKPLRETIRNSPENALDEVSSRYVLVPLYVCPSDPASDLRKDDGTVGTNYAGNFGTGVQRYGYNGMFRNATDWGLHKGGPIRPADVRDGLSQTAMLCEILVADGTGARLRTNWRTDRRLDGPEQLNEFARLCKNWTPQRLSGDVWNGDSWFRGRPWTWGQSGTTMYNHVLTPNQLSCYNDGLVQEGIYSAASLHRGGVNLLFADGRAEFVSETIDGQVWTDLGSRGSK